MESLQRIIITCPGDERSGSEQLKPISGTAPGVTGTVWVISKPRSKSEPRYFLRGLPETEYRSRGHAKVEFEGWWIDRSTRGPWTFLATEEQVSVETLRETSP